MGSLPAVLADTAPPIMVIDQQCRGQWQCHADAHGWHLPVSPRTHGGEGTGDHAQHHRGIGMPVGLGGGHGHSPHRRSQWHTTMHLGVGGSGKPTGPFWGCCWPPPTSPGSWGWSAGLGLGQG